MALASYLKHHSPGKGYHDQIQSGALRNIRYQPKNLMPVFGYDNLMYTAIETELRLSMHWREVGIISGEPLWHC